MRSYRVVLADSGSSAGLGGGGIAAIAIVSLLILVGADTLVIIFLGWYWRKYKSDKTKRSGKYAVDNKGECVCMCVRYKEL